MIRSSKTSLKFSNTEKLNNLHKFISEYRSVVIKFVDLLWDEENIPLTIQKEFSSLVKPQTWLSSRAIQCAGKQASGIVRGTQSKSKRRLYMIKKLKSRGLEKRARKLQNYHDKCKLSKPEVGSVNPELDSRFVKIELNSDSSFDGWVTLTCLGDKMKLVIPFKKTKHFNKLSQLGTLKSGIRLSDKNITFMFDITEPINTGTEIIGVDIGVNNLLSSSNGKVNCQSKPDLHGHDLSSINSKLSRKKKGSKGFKKAQTHRTNYINWSINQLNLSNASLLKIENIKGLRKGSKTSRKLTHFVYREIFDKLEQKCELLGVQVKHVSPVYTSQRCSSCGWTRKLNRKGSLFKCRSCGYTQDADLNASNNIQLDLRPIMVEERLSNTNRPGFYWN